MGALSNVLLLTAGGVLAVAVVVPALVPPFPHPVATGAPGGGDPPPPPPAAAFNGAWATAGGLAAATTRIGSGRIRSGETVFFHPAACTPFTADAVGRLWRLPPPLPSPPLSPPTDGGGDGGGREWAAPPPVPPPAPTLVALLGGTPLGAAFDVDGTALYVADATRGLLRLRVDPTTGAPVGGGGGVEVLAHAAPLPARPAGGGDLPPASAADARPIAYANDVDVDPSGGTVYFTDSSVVAPPVSTAGGGGDTYEASVLDAMSGRPTGRLLAVDAADPASGRVAVVTNHTFYFANGVAVAPDGRSVVVAETYGARLWRVSVADGAVTPFGDVLPGLPDGLSRDDSAAGGYWVSLYVPVPPAVRALRRAPEWVRRLALAVPRRLRPYRAPHSIVAHMTEAGVVDARMGDPQRALGLVSSVGRCVPRGGGAPTPLYVGVLHGDFVGRVDGGGEGTPPQAMTHLQGG